MWKSRRILEIAALTLLLIEIPPLAMAQTDNVKISMSTLTAELEQLGVPKIEDGELYFGKTKASEEAVDAVVKKQAGVATVFRKTADTYVRAATTVKKSMVPAPSARRWKQVVPPLPS